MAAGYRVVSQRQTIELTPDGRFVDVMEVTAETPHGATFTVRVPLSAYTADTVAALLAERAATISDIAGL